MKLEVLKSYVLIILVGISLILTFGLWTYQPNDEYLNRVDFVPEEQFDLGGQQLSKKDLVVPDLIIFKKSNQFYGFENPADRQKLYTEMQSWTLYNFREGGANGRPDTNNQIEVIFPVELPMDVVPSLFTINNSSEVHYPDWSFKRMFIHFKADNSLTLEFLSIDGRRRVQVDVNNKSHYDLLRNQLSSLNGLMEYMEFGPLEKVIYVPKNDLVLPRYTLYFQTIDTSLLEHAFFPNPSEIIRNISPNNEAYYQDGQRTMLIFPDGKSMEYVNPQDTLINPMTVNELLESSINNINSYKGWLNDYHLSSVDRSQNLIRYRLYNDGYPVFYSHFSGQNLDILEQHWRNAEVYQQFGPLYTITSSFPDGEKSLPSGVDVEYMLKNNSEIDLERISDIKVGYRLRESSINSSFQLEPAWYMQYDGTWVEIYVDTESESKGVS